MKLVIVRGYTVTSDNVTARALSDIGSEVTYM